MQRSNEILVLFCVYLLSNELIQRKQYFLMSWMLILHYFLSYFSLETSNIKDMYGYLFILFIFDLFTNADPMIYLA